MKRRGFLASVAALFVTAPVVAKLLPKKSLLLEGVKAHWNLSGKTGKEYPSAGSYLYDHPESVPQTWVITSVDHASRTITFERPRA